jgi:hypothetical protein
VHLFDIDAIPPRALWLVMHPDAAARAAVRAVAEHVAHIVGRGSVAASRPRAT